MSEAQATLDEIKAIYTEHRDALLVQVRAGQITVEEFRAEVVPLAKEARRHSDSVRASVQHQRDQLHRLIALGRRWGWAQDEAGEWRMYVETDAGYWMPMP